MRPRFKGDELETTSHLQQDRLIQLVAHTVNVYLKRDVARFSLKENKLNG
jgi:hypothetical protein